MERLYFDFRRNILKKFENRFPRGMNNLLTIFLVYGTPGVRVTLKLVCFVLKIFNGYVTNLIY